MLRRFGALATAAALSISALVALATPAHAAQVIYGQCSTLDDQPSGNIKADLVPPIGFGDPAHSDINILGTPDLRNCTDGSAPGTFPTSALLTASNVKTFKPGNCTTFGQGSAGKILALGNFNAAWNTGGPSSGVLKAKGHNDGNPLHIVIVLKVTAGQFLSPDSSNPTKIKSPLVQFGLEAGHGDCVSTPIDRVNATNFEAFVVSRKT